MESAAAEPSAEPAPPAPNEYVYGAAIGASGPLSRAAGEAPQMVLGLALIALGYLLLGPSPVLARWLPRRWSRSRSDSPPPRATTIEVRSSPLVVTTEDSPLGASWSSALSYMHSAARETSAANAGVDIATYNLMMDLQHRDITPEDYDTLRRASPLVSTSHITHACDSLLLLCA